jgi:hypothetical protein
MESNDIISRKQRIIYLCNEIILGNIDIIEAMREIKSLNFRVGPDQRIENFIPDGKLSNFCTLFEDETELIPKGKHKEYCAQEFLKQMEEEERNLIELYKGDLIEFAKKTIQLLQEY